MQSKAEDVGTQMTGSQPQSKTLLLLHETLLCLNLVLIVFSILIIRGFTYLDTKYGHVARGSFKYYFLRSTGRLGRTLHLLPYGEISQEITLLASIAAITLSLLAVLQLLRRTVIYRYLLNPISGITALLAFPAMWVWASSLISSQTEGNLPAAFWTSPIPIMLMVEALVILVVLFVIQKWTAPMWLCWIVFGFHYAFWTAEIVTGWSGIWRGFSPPFLPFLTAGVFFCAGLAWLFYIGELIGISRPITVTLPNRRLTFVIGTVSVLLLLLLWLPLQGQSVSLPEEKSRLTIQMHRGTCFGRCPVYDLTIHGTGIVEYLGQHNVTIKGPQSTTIDSVQLSRLLQDLDYARFFSLDDNAFDRCHDTPEVSLSLSVDGRQKTVTSDTYCIGAESGPQAKFVRISDEIDKIVGSDRWVQCSTDCRP